MVTNSVHNNVLKNQPGHYQACMQGHCPHTHFKFSSPCLNLHLIYNHLFDKQGHVRKTESSLLSPQPYLHAQSWTNPALPGLLSPVPSQPHWNMGQEQPVLWPRGQWGRAGAAESKWQAQATQSEHQTQSSSPKPSCSYRVPASSPGRALSACNQPPRWEQQDWEVKDAEIKWKIRGSWSVRLDFQI